MCAPFLSPKNTIKCIAIKIVGGGQLVLVRHGGHTVGHGITTDHNRNILFFVEGDWISGNIKEQHAVIRGTRPAAGLLAVRIQFRRRITTDLRPFDATAEETTSGHVIGFAVNNAMC